MINSMYLGSPSGTILGLGALTALSIYSVEALVQDNSAHELSKIVASVAGTMFMFIFPTYGWDSANGT